MGGACIQVIGAIFIVCSNIVCDKHITAKRLSKPYVCWQMQPESQTCSERSNPSLNSFYYIDVSAFSTTPSSCFGCGLLARTRIAKGDCLRPFNAPKSSTAFVKCCHIELQLQLATTVACTGDDVTEPNPSVHCVSRRARSVYMSSLLILNHPSKCLRS